MTKDNCGLEVDCGPCGGGGCTSDDPAVTCAGKCSTVKDNCGRDVDCGNTCSGVETCGGGGTSNACGCTSQPQSVTCDGRCGMESDNCGPEVDCGTCPGGGCFIGGTEVRMADGSDKPIELVEPGDRVLGRGEEDQPGAQHPLPHARRSAALRARRGESPPSPRRTVPDHRRLESNRSGRCSSGGAWTGHRAADRRRLAAVRDVVGMRGALDERQGPRDGLARQLQCTSTGSRYRASRVAPPTQRPSSTTSTSMETTPTWQMAWSSTISIVRGLGRSPGSPTPAFPSHWFTGEGNAGIGVAGRPGNLGAMSLDVRRQR